MQVAVSEEAAALPQSGLSSSEDELDAQIGQLASPDAAGDMQGLPEFLVKKKPFKWPEKPKKKLSVLQQELKAERKVARKLQKIADEEERVRQEEFRRKLAAGTKLPFFLSSVILILMNTNTNSRGSAKDSHGR